MQDLVSDPGGIQTAGRHRVSGFTERYPGAPRVLFVGSGDSSHEHSWIDLLRGCRMNVRLFARHGEPPADFDVPTYLAGAKNRTGRSPTRRKLYSGLGPARVAQSLYARYILGGPTQLAEHWLARIIREWRPDIIHTFGLQAAAHFLRGVRRRHGLESIGLWVLQTRGGSDFELVRFDPLERQQMQESLQACDRLVCDNEVSYRYARELGVRDEQIAPVGTVPGTGGVDVPPPESLARTSRRKLIIWPKAYDSPWSRSLPVIEAIRQVGSDLGDFELHAFAACDLTKQWLRTLPQATRDRIRIHGRIHRSKLLEITAQARVSISPSLVDGIPNTMIEAMAYGAVPIVSPLETLDGLVENGRNVLHARNLYPEEIASAIRRGLCDDSLADDIALRNAEHVRTFADRSLIRGRIVGFYEQLAAEPAHARA